MRGREGLYCCLSSSLRSPTAASREHVLELASCAPRPDARERARRRKPALFLRRRLRAVLGGQSAQHSTRRAQASSRACLHTRVSKVGRASRSRERLSGRGADRARALACSTSSSTRAALPCSTRLSTCWISRLRPPSRSTTVRSSRTAPTRRSRTSSPSLSLSRTSAVLKLHCCTLRTRPCTQACVLLDRGSS